MSDEHDDTSQDPEAFGEFADHVRYLRGRLADLDNAAQRGHQVPPAELRELAYVLAALEGAVFRCLTTWTPKRYAKLADLAAFLHEGRIGSWSVSELIDFSNRQRLQAN